MPGASGDKDGHEKLLTGDDDREEIIAPSSEPPFALKSPFRFGARMLGGIFLLKILIVLLVLVPLYLLFPMKEILTKGSITEDVMRGGKFLIFASFMTLPIETFLGQGLPIWVLSKCHVKSHRVLCALSAICFGLLHLSSGALDVFNGFIAGLILSYCWLSWRPDSLGLAFWGTTFVHAAHNGTVFVFLGLLSGLGPGLSPGSMPGKEPPAYMDRAESTGVMQRAAERLLSLTPTLSQKEREILSSLRHRPTSRSRSRIK